MVTTFSENTTGAQRLGLGGSPHAHKAEWVCSSVITSLLIFRKRYTSAQSPSSSTPPSAPSLPLISPLSAHAPRITSVRTTSITCPSMHTNYKIHTYNYNSTTKNERTNNSGRTIRGVGRICCTLRQLRHFLLPSNTGRRKCTLVK